MTALFYIPRMTVLFYVLLCVCATAASPWQPLLNVINMFRYQHGAPGLTLTDNISYTNASTFSVNDLHVYVIDHSMIAVNAWYNEGFRYNYDNQAPQPNTQNFTRMIWRSSRELGCKLVSRNNTKTLFCSYNPPGNIPGEYQYNIRP